LSELVEPKALRTVNTNPNSKYCAGVLSSGLDKLKRFLALSLLTALSFNIFANRLWVIAVVRLAKI
jgi:hypothetical protein